MRTPKPYLVNPPELGRGAALIHRVQAKAKPAPMDKENKQVAKKRKKLYGAADKAHAKKLAKSSGKRRKATRRVSRKSARKATRKAAVRAMTMRSTSPKRRRSSGRRRHMVTRYHRKGGRVSAYSRGGANVSAHWSNPFGMGQAGSVAVEGLIGAGAILGTLLVVGFANRQLQRFGPTQAGWGNLAGKLALAVAGGMVAVAASKRRMIRPQVAFAIAGAAMAPLLLGGLAMAVPQVAGNISLAADDEEMEGVRAGMSGVVEHGAVGAELQAQLEAQLEAELQDEVEAGMI